MDSGCSVFVMPTGWLSMFEIEESEGSKRGQTFQAAAANSDPIRNEGQRSVKFLTSAVNKILASAAQVCDGGNEVIFRRHGGEVIHLKTKKRTPFRRVGNVYIMDAWIEKPRNAKKESDKMDIDSAEPTGFSRPDAR